MYMDDTKRLDALGEYGLCIATHEALTTTGWQTTWVCTYITPQGEERVILGPTIRDVIDTAILDLTSTPTVEH